MKLCCRFRTTVDCNVDAVFAIPLGRFASVKGLSDSGREESFKGRNSTTNL